jgi:hypothetical protein
MFSLDFKSFHFSELFIENQNLTRKLVRSGIVARDYSGAPKHFEFAAAAI